MESQRDGLPFPAVNHYDLKFSSKNLAICIHDTHSSKYIFPSTKNLVVFAEDVTSLLPFSLKLKFVPS